jgi:hypothetical protein
MKTKIVGIFVVTLLIATALPISAQIKSIDTKRYEISNSLNGGWYKTYGGMGVNAFKGLDLTPDGGFIVAGQTEINGSLDAWIVKMDINGNILWETIYGNPDGDDGFWPVISTSDGGYFAGGWYYNSSSEKWDALMMKTDANGTISWIQTFGGAEDDLFFGVIETSDGFIGVGYTKSFTSGLCDALIVKTDFNGTMIWMKTIGKKKYYYELDSIIEAHDGNSYLISGGYASQQPLESGNGWLLKIDEDGNELWNRSYGTSLLFDWLPGITPTNDGYIMVGGTRGGPFGSLGLGLWGTDIWLIKTDEEGNKEWEKRFGVPFLIDYSMSVQQTDDDGFILVGHAYGIGMLGEPQFGSWSKICLIKTDSNGNINWTRIMPGNGHGRTVREIEGGFIICGYTGDGHADTSEYAVLIKTDKNGKI